MNEHEQKTRVACSGCPRCPPCLVFRYDVVCACASQTSFPRVMLRHRDSIAMAAEEPEDKGPPRWEVQVVGLQGVITDCVQIFGDDTSTIRDLQKTLVSICGVPTADQKLCVGGSLCRPRQLLDACLAKGSKSTVTLIKVDPASRRCQGCGGRGGFGAVARLRRCSGCTINPQ